MNKFDQGVLYAAALLVRLHDAPVLSAAIIKEAGLGEADCKDLDDFEKEILHKLKGEKGINFRGL